MSKTYSVYRILFDDDAAYYGVTSQALSDRMFQHSHSRHNEDLAKRFDSRQVFGVSILSGKLTKPQALALERGYIRSGKNVLNVVGPGIPSRQHRTGSKKIQLNVAFPVSQLEQIKYLAKKDDVSMAEFVRRTVERELVRRLGKYASNRASLRELYR